MKLTKPEARRYLLQYQNLLPPNSVAGKTGVMDFIRRVGSIQFDPLDPVGCNPHLVLQSRVKGYKALMLDELLYKDRLLIDGFDKNLCIWPVEDWPCFRRNHRDMCRWFDQSQQGFADAVAHVRAAIAEKGALCSADFEAREKVNWPWGPTNAVRAALEGMYFQGQLVIHHKMGTRKYYDLAERHIAPDILCAPDPNPCDRDWLRWRVLRRVGSVGMLRDKAGDAWLGIGGLKSAERAEAFRALVSSGELEALDVEGLDTPFFIRSADLPLLEQAAGGEAPPQRMAFIAPLDNLIWDRRMIRDLFGFEYTWEVYAPREKRKYGYYVLPVLCGDRFIARVEPKFSKKTKTLELLNWWWEDGVKPNADMKKAFRQCVKEFMAYLGAKDINYKEGYTGLKI